MKSYKKYIFFFLFSFLFLLIPCINGYAETLSVTLEGQENSDKTKIRFISTMENLTDLDSISRIDITFELAKDGYDTRSVTISQTTVYDEVSGTNGKSKMDNTYYALYTITNLNGYPGWTISATFNYILESTTLATNKVSYEIPEETFDVTYNLNGGTLDSIRPNAKASVTLDYYNQTSVYLTTYMDAVYFHDNETENSFGYYYTLRIGINENNYDNEFIVSTIYESGTKDYGIFDDDYAIVVHYDNVDDFNILSTISVGDLVVIDEMPSASGAISTLATFYDSYSTITKSYETDSGSSTTPTSLYNFTITKYNVTNSQYNSYAGSDIMLNDSDTEYSLGALYSLRIGMSQYSSNDYIIDQIFASGTSDYHQEASDLTLVVHSSYSEGYNILKNLVLNQIVSLSEVPTSSGSVSVDANVYDKDDYDSSNSTGISLPTPAKKGYSFIGWYSDSAFTTLVTKVNSDTTVYAKFEASSYDAYTYRTSTSYIYGNDVSYYQGDITMSTYKANSNFMITRIGYSTSSNVQYMDSKFLTYVADATSAGIPLGLYLYSKADSTSEATDEANWIIEKLSENGFDQGTFSYPIFIDYEETDAISSRTKAENTEIVNAFANTLIEAGYYPGLYIGGSNWNSYMNQDDVICDVWVASYYEKDSIDSAITASLSKYATSTKVTMIQFDDGQKNTASLSGATLGCSSTYVDQDVCFVDYPTIIKERHFNGY